MTPGRHIVKVHLGETGHAKSRVTTHSAKTNSPKSFRLSRLQDFVPRNYAFFRVGMHGDSEGVAQTYPAGLRTQLHEKSRAWGTAQVPKSASLS
jgi:hypothetical protein